ncbi:MAG: aminotransferase class I/II-fold pyridoxal phosphate-dependent enzyme [Deltaproteobacteria bacterium]|nr:aminotransferase class I/II-fold pyridoxal phosphate-dependent enzyme [Deltaproteobacteria bacterium]
MTWQGVRFNQQLKKHLACFAEQVFLIDQLSDQTHTYKSLWAEAAKWQFYFSKQGLKKGDRVLVCCDNSFQLAEAYFGFLRAGLVVVPVSRETPLQNLKNLYQRAQAKYFFSDHPELVRGFSKINLGAFDLSQVEQIDSLLSSDEMKKIKNLKAVSWKGDDELCLVFTSGTTSEPKGVVHKISSLFANADLFGDVVGIQAGQRFLNYLPMTYLGGYYNLLLLPFVCGAQTVICSVYSARTSLSFWKMVNEKQATALWMTPSIIAGLLKIDRSQIGTQYCERIKPLVLCGTAPLPLSLRQRFYEKYKTNILENYGLSETLFICSQRPGDFASGNALDGVGKILSGVDCLQDQQGALLVKTPFLMKGYLQEQGFDPQLNEDGFFATGDLVKITNDQIQINGRQKDLIIRSGINISPLAVENAILQNQEVAECAVVGRRHAILGEEIVAFLSLKEATRFSSVVEKIKESLQTQLEKQQQPSDYILLQNFPKTASGKIQKAKLRSLLELESHPSAPTKQNDSSCKSPCDLLSQKAQLLAPAESVAVNQKVYDHQNAGDDVTVLSLGEAFFDLPFFSFSDLPEEKIYHYSSSFGLPELREKIAKYLQETHSIKLDWQKELLLTAGSKVALFMIMQALCDPGDEVIVFEPYWVSYPEQIRLVGAKPVFVPNGVSVFEIEKFITRRTKAIIINNPNNPTGQVLSLKELSHLLEVSKNQGLMLVSDEAYSEFVPNEGQFVSVSMIDPEKKHSIVVNSLSKNFGLSGWRIGYVIAHPDIMQSILYLNQHLITCPPTVLCYYVAKHFEELVAATKPQIKTLLEKRERLAQFAKANGLHVLAGDSTFYFFLSIGSQQGSRDFAASLLTDHKIAVVPGIGYGDSCDGFLRLSIGTESEERIQKALLIIKEKITAQITTDQISEESIEKGIHQVLFNLGNLKKEESVCVVVDAKTSALGQQFSEYMGRSGVSHSLCEVPLQAMHGSEPPPEVASEMKSSDLILGLTTQSMAHTDARLQANRAGARYLSMPDFSENVMTHPALFADYQDRGMRLERLVHLLNRSHKLRVVTASGTDLTLDISTRQANFCPGYVDEHHELGSPPDIEVNVAPLENHSHGTLVVDGSIPCDGIGKLDAPVTLIIENGKIAKIQGAQDVVKKLEDLFGESQSPKRVLAEFGIGFNDRAELCGNMLIDEGCYGTFHCGFGSNATIGGLNRVSFHLDFVFFADAVYLDDELVRV